MAETAGTTQNKRRQRAPRNEASDGMESTTVGIYRTSAVVKGGRRFSFGALVVVGDRGGQVGIGYGKAPGVPAAIEKAQKAARRSLVRVVLQGETLPHPVQADFNASSVRLLPAAPGTGVIAGATVRAVLELAGVRDCLTKAYGSRNQKNLCKAALRALTILSTREQIQSLRGLDLEETEVEDRVKVGAKYAPVKTAADWAERVAHIRANVQQVMGPLHDTSRWRLVRRRGVGPYTSSDRDTQRIWWSDVGVHQNLTFPVHPDPISGQHCWHQAVRIRPAEPGDAYGDISVDTARARAEYHAWLARAKPASHVSPDGTRRPYWLLRPLKPGRDAYRLP